MGSQDLHDHYGRLLGLRSPWKVTGVEFDSSASRVMIDVEHSKEKPPCCPSCQKPGSRKDSRLREWRHLDVYQYTSVIRCWVPRVALRGARGPSNPRSLGGAWIPLYGTV